MSDPQYVVGININDNTVVTYASLHGKTAIESFMPLQMIGEGELGKLSQLSSCAFLSLSTSSNDGVVGQPTD